MLIDLRPLKKIKFQLFVIYHDWQFNWESLTTSLGFNQGFRGGKTKLKNVEIKIVIKNKILVSFKV